MSSSITLQARRSSPTRVTTRTGSGRRSVDKKKRAVIGSKPERPRKLPKSRELYAKRYLVECFFHNLKRVRAIATRFEKTARNFLALTQVACAWLSLAPN